MQLQFNQNIACRCSHNITWRPQKVNITFVQSYLFDLNLFKWKNMGGDNFWYYYLTDTILHLKAYIKWQFRFQYYPNHYAIYLVLMVLHIRLTILHIIMFTVYAFKHLKVSLSYPRQYIFSVIFSDHQGKPFLLQFNIYEFT